jgi:hypothetical protein
MGPVACQHLAACREASMLFEIVEAKRKRPKDFMWQFAVTKGFRGAPADLVPRNCVWMRKRNIVKRGT